MLVDVEKEVQAAVDDLGAESVEKRRWATVILGRYPRFAEGAIPALRRALEDQEWQVRLGAARALEAVGPRAPDMATVAAIMRLFPESAEALFDPTDLARDAASLLRDTLDAEQALASSTAWMEAAEPRAARLGAAVAVLDAKIAFSEVPHLLDHYEAGSSASTHAARAMAPHLAAFHPDLRTSLGVGDLEARRRAALTVGMLGIAEPALLSALADLLSQQTPLAEAAARAFGMIGESARAQTPAIKSLLLSGAGRQFREAAALALIRVDRQAAETAAEELRNTDSEFSLWLEKAILVSRL